MAIYGCFFKGRPIVSINSVACGFVLQSRNEKFILKLSVEFCLFVFGMMKAVYTLKIYRITE